MALNVAPCGAGDVLAFQPQPDQAWDGGVDLTKLESYRPDGMAWTLRSARGEVIAVGGFMPRYPAVLHAWSLIGSPRRAEWGGLLAFARSKIAAIAPTSRRIEAFCRADRPGQIAVLNALGFRQETPEPMVGYHPVYPCLLFAQGGALHG